MKFIHAPGGSHASAEGAAEALRRGAVLPEIFLGDLQI